MIGPNGLFHLETKNHYGEGKIIIDKYGNWIKEVDNKSTSIENPAQVDRHDTVLKDFLNKNFAGVRIPIHPLIVIATTKYMLEGLEYSAVPVVKVDQLQPFIKKYNSEIILENDIVEKLYDRLSGYVSGSHTGA